MICKGSLGACNAFWLEIHAGDAFWMLLVCEVQTQWTVATAKVKNVPVCYMSVGKCGPTA